MAMMNMDAKQEQLKNMSEETARLFAEAFANEDADKMKEGVLRIYKEIEQGVIQDYRNLQNETDMQVLASRGVRQLTSEERNYYEQVIAAMRSGNPKEALTNVDITFPITIIDAVFDELTTEHPLLSAINFREVTGLTKVLTNTNGEQRATWGALTDEIKKELTSGFEEVDMSLYKLSAFIPISKPMLDLGPVWLDTYIRRVLAEALANGLEWGIINGNGTTAPIGMMCDVSEGVAVVAGAYPTKEATAITKLDLEQLGKLTSLMAINKNGVARTIRNLILIVNPADYFSKVLPAMNFLTPMGTYVNALPFAINVIQSPYVPIGSAIYGMADKYMIGGGMAKDGRIEYDDSYRFLEDERVYLIKLYANGYPMDNNAFQLLDISELQPMAVKVENVTPEVVEDNADLTSLKIGALTLTPEFASETTTYTAATTDATNTITAVPAKASCEITITVGDDEIQNGTAATWSDGSNTVKIVTKDGKETKTYTVTVTKS